MYYLFYQLSFLFLFFGCHSAAIQEGKQAEKNNIILGAEQFGQYLPMLKDKNVGLVINHTSLVNGTHLLDTLLVQNVKVTKLFSPEHGFRGKKGAGELIESGVDAVTGLPIISLYGNHKKPTAEDLQNIDIVLFDIQDVGTRFYTYISTMHYVMEACAENNLPLLVLDRPNPNGMYIDGPVLKEEFKSFVGMHPIPVLHGCTVGELARMINGEGWLANEEMCDLQVVEMKNYTHEKHYQLPVKPSPNLPNQQSIMLYPSLCFFEGTMMSIGRGTDFPFQVVGYPDPQAGEFTFKPEDREGASINPKHESKMCYGINLQNNDTLRGIDLQLLIDYHQKFKQPDFFTSYFNLLAGTDELREQIEAGLDQEAIRVSWLEDLQNYKQIRQRYLLY